MSSVFLSRATVVWLFLMIATGMSWWLGFDHRTAYGQLGQYGAITLVIVAFVKIRLVVLYFMEVNEAPWTLRLILDAWVVGVGAAIVLVYWLGLP